MAILRADHDLALLKDPLQQAKLLIEDREQASQGPPDDDTPSQGLVGPGMGRGMLTARRRPGTTRSDLVTREAQIARHIRATGDHGVPVEGLDLLVDLSRLIARHPQ